MSPLFTVNFRREAYQLEMATARRRAVAVGTWVAYYGALAVVLGLYGLNLATLSRRTQQLERQNASLRNTQVAAPAWKPAPADVALAERALASPALWHSRLERLAALLPPNAALTSVVVNPENPSDPARREELVVTGLLRPAPGQDRMAGIMGLVAVLRADSVFGARYRSVRLAESRVAGEGDAPAEFKIECR